MTTSGKTRLYLYIGSVLTILVVSAFLVILNINEPVEYTRVPFNVLAILTVISCIAMTLFFAKGPVFDIYGQLESTNINAMLLTVIIIIQISFFFEIISVKNQLLNYQVYTDIRNDINVASTYPERKLDDLLESLCKDSITEISITDMSGTVLHSSNKSIIGSTAEHTRYTYSFNKNSSIRFSVDPFFVRNKIKSIALNLLTVLVTSVFFSVEIVLLMIMNVSKGMTKRILKDYQQDKDKRSQIPEDEYEKIKASLENADIPSALYYIRQIAFLFYFASRLSSSFIPIVAKSLNNPIKGMAATTAAGIPQSAETLLTCSAIFITTVMLEKKGWKFPFISGLLLVSAGTLSSALSTNLFLFVLSRALVGLGYGFCWMTLRNLSLFGKNAKQQLLGFALLNAGIYSGMNCGSSLGAILADVFGYKTVFFISAVFTLMTSVFIIRLENALLPKTKSNDTEIRQTAKISFNDNISVFLFVILMIAPASIAASFLSYYLPLYFDSMGGSITDVGRSQMLYGILLVYAGPTLSVFISKLKGKSLKRINYVYNLIIALSLLFPVMGASLFLPYVSACLLGTADSFGFGVQNNYFLGLPAVQKLGPSKSLSVLSFIKKMLEMIGPFVFAAALTLGYRAGIGALAVAFAIMAIAYFIHSEIMQVSKTK
ncbi:Predicted arabinose efflux permease, MFS family [Oribacterium sp. KHPX15]|uniref:MFS transporter n=1 Tax=Oribacterium sp. KHPX15 TaxID=1855342 RepID=UPI000898BC2A|nr:MFS transporter [Oribacterium sp. KHPX15]SEA59417.1 Predicted arabinose efflux permease, MFS family [Oribacterium sp. KHPX15]